MLEESRSIIKKESITIRANTCLNLSDDLYLKASNPELLSEMPENNPETETRKQRIKSGPEEEMAGLLLVLRGQGLFQDSRLEEDIQYSAGKLIFFSNIRDIDLCSSSDGRMDLLFFPANLMMNPELISTGVKYILPGVYGSLKTLVFSQAEQEDKIFFEIFDDLSKRCQSNRAADCDIENLLTYSLLWQWLYQVNKYLKNKGEDKEIRSFTKNAQRLRPVIRHLHTNYESRLSLGDLSEVANMSVPNFSALFRKTYNTSPMAYLTKLRLERALELLLTTNKKIIDVAEESGFFSISNFIKVFQKHLGMSPSEYRKTNVA